MAYAFLVVYERAVMLVCLLPVPLHLPGATLMMAFYLSLFCLLNVNIYVVTVTVVIIVGIIFVIVINLVINIINLSIGIIDVYFEGLNEMIESNYEQKGI